MEILLVGTKLTPWLSTADAGEELSALGKAFKQLGHDVTMVVPYDAAYERGGLLVARRLTPLELSNGHAITVFDAQLASGAKVVLLGMPAGADETFRRDLDPTAATLMTAVSFARAVAAYVDLRADQSQAVDVVHLFDWTVALAGFAVRTLCQNVPNAIVLSVRDTVKTGMASATMVSLVGDPLLAEPALRLGDDICLLKAGLLSADSVIFQSESALRQMTTNVAHSLLGQVFSTLSAQLLAISPGVDYATVNPAVNPCLLSRYDAEDARNKSANKTEWLRQLGLPLTARPLVLVPGPISTDNGGDVLVAAIDAITEMDISLGVWSTPEDNEPLIRTLGDYASRRSDVVKIVERTADEQIHRGFAAADFVLYPKRDGLGLLSHLAAQRYGALVIGDGSSTVGESVVDADAALTTGTGFLFNESTETGILGALGRALTAYGSSQFEVLRRRVMRQDSSWDRPARRLLRLYEKARSLTTN
jgi:starch synthase